MAIIVYTHRFLLITEYSNLFPTMNENWIISSWSKSCYCRSQAYPCCKKENVTYLSFGGIKYIQRYRCPCVGKPWRISVNYFVPHTDFIFVLTIKICNYTQVSANLQFIHSSICICTFWLHWSYLLSLSSNVSSPWVSVEGPLFESLALKEYKLRLCSVLLCSIAISLHFMS